MVHAAPISHGSGLWNFSMVARGVTQVFPESGKYEVPETVALMNRWPDCSIFLAPTMVKRLVEHASVQELKPGALRLISYGGAPMYVSDLKRALDMLGNVLCQLYGQGESPMTITHLAREIHAQRQHRAGRRASLQPAWPTLASRCASSTTTGGRCRPARSARSSSRATR
jgi:acyl-CoA synthetase (AMP-forming)/AMP-acid ligase II